MSFFVERLKGRMEASFTIEAALVLSMVFLTLGALIQHAYRLHDTVTGSMILEETLERARQNRDEEKTASCFAEEGERTGNPRLWLGSYRLEITADERLAAGTAAAGDWAKEMEMKTFWPERSLRMCQALLEMRKNKSGS
ncbi:MAG: hypothetical protein HFE83_10825 [Lachnospiraceae bacterium]|nr:hypothetical protein [Lachnospiraceae bacterium]